MPRRWVKAPPGSPDRPRVGIETHSGQGQASTKEESALLRRALAGNGVRALFQPVVRLDNGDVVAYEALVRGPVGSSLERPDRLFAVARQEGLLAELDWACRAAAWRAVEAADVPRGRTILVNVEPEVLGLGTPPWAEELMTKAGSHLRLFVEITERALPYARPSCSPRSRDFVPADGASRSTMWAPTIARSRSCPSCAPT